MSRSKSPSQGESSALRARAPERRPGAKRTIRKPRRVNLVFEADHHSDLIRFLGWRQNREGVEISMGRVLMQALRTIETPITKAGFLEAKGIFGQLIPFSGPNTDCVGFEEGPGPGWMTRYLVAARLLPC